jgi:hypothetical protein
VFVKVERGAAGCVEVHLRQPDAIRQPHIVVDLDVSVAEMGRALFESGAAVQQADDGFLLSHDWLLRSAAGFVEDADEWAGRVPWSGVTRARGFVPARVGPGRRWATA